MSGELEDPHERVKLVLGSLVIPEEVGEDATLRDCGVRVILSESPEEKVALTVAAYRRFTSPELELGEPRNIGEGERRGACVPGLILMHASRLPNIGKGGSEKSRAMILHALVHVELAAVDIAWDLIVRDWGDVGAILPKQFYLDMLEVAYEEAKHYLILRSRLKELVSPDGGKHYDYGSFPAHDGIWHDALRTASSLGDRLALEHLTHEARGVDVCSLSTVPRLRRGGDEASARLLEEVVLVDEMDHVRKGLKYFTLLVYGGQDRGIRAGIRAGAGAGAGNEEEEEAEVVRCFHDTLTRVQGYCFSKGPFALELRRQAGLPDLLYLPPPSPPSPPSFQEEEASGAGAIPAPPSAPEEREEREEGEEGGRRGVRAGRGAPLPVIALALLLSLLITILLPSASAADPPPRPAPRPSRLEKDMWSLLDSLVAAFPDQPSEAQQAAAASLLSSLSALYPDPDVAKVVAAEAKPRAQGGGGGLGARTSSKAALRDFVCEVKRFALGLTSLRPPSLSAASGGEGEGEGEGEGDRHDECEDYFVGLPADAVSARPQQKGACSLGGEEGGVNEWLQGETTLRSGAMTLLIFVSQRCLVCHEVLPKIDRLYRAYRRNGLNVVAIHSSVKGHTSSPEDRHGMLAFFRRKKIAFPLVDMTFKVGREPADDEGNVDWRAAARMPVRPSSFFRHFFGDMEFVTPLAFIIKNCQPLMERPIDSYLILGLDVSIARAAEQGKLLWPDDVSEPYEDPWRPDEAQASADTHEVDEDEDEDDDEQIRSRWRRKRGGGRDEL